jgi:hypothetical protein
MSQNEEPSEPNRRVPTGHLSEIVGDAARITDAYRNAAIAPSVAMQEQIRASMAKMGPQAAIRDASTAAIKALGDLRKFDVPKIDWPAMVESARIPKIDVSEHITPRITPLEIEMPKPVRSIVDIRLEELGKKLDVVAGTLNQLIDVAEAETAAIVAMHESAEAQAARSESLADDRAADADNRAAWNVTFAAVAAICAFILVLDIVLR